MPLREPPTFKPVQDSMFEIPQPGIGGLNLKDLEFEQNPYQSPYMLNMMYRNGAFSKRYGQEIYESYTDTIYATSYFEGDLIVHAGTKVYKGHGEGKTQIASGLPESGGMFVRFGQALYYFNVNIYRYERSGDTYTWGQITPYVPQFFFNTKPDGSAKDVNDDLNIIGLEFYIDFNGDGTSTVFVVPSDETLNDHVDWTVTPTVTVDDVEQTAGTDFTYDSSAHTITFINEAPPDGTNTVSTKWTLKTTATKEDRDRILASKYHIAFGNNNSSRIFLAGGGDSKLFYSDSYDITYFPENNWEIIGNTEEDITGFGLQYNVLIIFKPKEVYSMTSFVETAYTTVIEEQYGLEGFKSQLVNAAIGCDAPFSIQLIDNQLTWFNSTQGICTLVSTNILDERNVRPISRNIDKTNNFGVTGVLDSSEDLTKIRSMDYDNKYFLVFPTNGKCFMWDYQMAPYSVAYKGTNVASLDWFLFDNFYVGSFIKLGNDLMYASSHENFNSKIILLNESFSDLDFNMDGEPDGINAYYMTPFLQFNAVAYLKNVKNIYVQCRGDTSSIIDMYYYTEESTIPEAETDSIRIGGRLWHAFHWENFQWLLVNWANTFRRKCSLKKVQMASFYFENQDKYIYNGETIKGKINVKGHYSTLSDLETAHPTSDDGDVYSVDDKFYVYHSGYKEVEYVTVAGRDMSISHIALQYSIVKNIK